MTLKIEAGKKHRTRGGDEVKILRILVNPTLDPVVAILTHPNGDEEALTYRIDGRFPCDTAASLDLISEIKPKRVVWLNVYGDAYPCFYYPSREVADAGAGTHRIACIRLEFEEGQFDD